MCKKSFLPKKYYFVRVPKIAVFSSINADVLSQMTLNSLYFFLYLLTLLVAEVVLCRMIGLLVNNELSRMWKEAIVA
jgi:hypothetical protein